MRIILTVEKCVNDIKHKVVVLYGKKCNHSLLLAENIQIPVKKDESRNKVRITKM